MRVLFFVAAIAATLLGTGLAKISIAGNPTQLIASSSERYQAYAEILKRFPGEENQVQLFGQGSGPVLAPTHLRAYQGLLAPLEKLPEVVQVSSLFSSPMLANALTQLIEPPDGSDAFGSITDVTQLLSQPDYLFSRMLSGDGNVSLMTLSLAAVADHDQALSAIESVLTHHLASHPDVRWSIAGNPVIERAIRQDVLSELVRVTGLAMLFGVLIAWCVLRSLAAVAQVIAVPLFTVIGTLSIAGWLGMTLSVMSPSMLIVVFLVVFTDTLHAMAGGRSRHSLLVACGLTSVATAAAAVSLLFARSEVIQSFGASLLLGIATGFTVWLVWLLTYYERYWLNQSIACNLGLWPLYRRSLRGIRIALAVFSLLLLLIPASQLKTDFSLYENVPNAHQLTQALKTAETQFSGYLPLQIALKADSVDSADSTDEFLNAIRSIQTALNAEQDYSSPLSLRWYSIADLLAVTPGVDDTQRLARLPGVVRDNFWQPSFESVLFAPQSIGALLAAADQQLFEIDSRISSLAADVGLTASMVTGLPALVVEASDDAFTDASRSVVVTLLGLVLLVLISFKSVKFALIATVPVTFAVLGFAVTLVLLGEPLRHAGIIMMTLIIGISVDNALHLLTAVKLRGKTGRELAVRRCLPVLWASTLSIVAGFIALTLSHISTMVSVGFATAVALSIGFSVTALLADDFYRA